MTATDPATVTAQLTAALGRIPQATDVAARLHAKGFGRHTFLCGQSGSGKTYTLGVIPDRLLLDTDIRIGVIDHYSDYLILGSVRDSTPTTTASTT